MAAAVVSISPRYTQTFPPTAAATTTAPTTNNQAKRKKKTEKKKTLNILKVYMPIWVASIVKRTIPTMIQAS